ncbi:SDR family NAD(P)-dependent oxidoreductase [Paludibacterium paludis]|uniref:3-oxoacyl-ACP reductase n=1 Tax=Paludibacterium paludis TaxID=1225769 RepID=A0A918P499_9NEIS|nr:SDR family oxidoreductase [Paludibacterium paludis]GGY18380.1 3-oxoacyl-ACP reductase [Paludibacterium paludis]
MSSKIVIITGGGRGLGKSAALQAAGQGIDVILTWQSRRDEAEAVAGTIRAMGRKAVALPLDVSDIRTFATFADEVRAALAGHWGRETFDFLVNNAGIGIHVPFADTTEEQFDRLMNIHLKGVFFLTQHLLPLIADQGRIVNVATGLTRFALPGYSAYAMMKGGIEVLTRYLARELGERGIAVNTVAPGAIETDFGGGAVRDNAAINQYIASQTALGRAGQPDDIGGVVAALLTEDTRWINAQRIEASGGMFI